MQNTGRYHNWPYACSISGTAPQYLSDLLQPYTPARQLRSASDTRTFVTPRVNTKTFGERSFSYAGPSVWNNLLKHSAILILPPLSKPPSRRTCLITISKLFFTALPIPSSDTVCVCARARVCVCVRARARACVRVCVCACVCVVSVIVKRPVLPPSVVDGRSRNPLYYYYYYYFLSLFSFLFFFFFLSFFFLGVKFARIFMTKHLGTTVV